MRVSLLGLVVLTAISALACSVQAQSNYGGLPPGNYLQSCDSVAIRGSGASAVLVAQCRTQNGILRGSTLRYRDCQSPIENVDGRLACTLATSEWRPPGASSLPPGSYLDSCRGAIVRGYGNSAMVSAQCQMRDGRWRSTSLRSGDCRFGITNIDGQLVCDQPSNHQPDNGSYGQGGYGIGGYNSGGYGNYAGTITLFDRPGFSGGPFTTDREVTNLPREYNDRAMSLRVGRSVWQVCTDSDFRGHCETFDRDVRDLREYGLDQGISSMRPVN